MCVQWSWDRQVCYLADISVLKRTNSYKKSRSSSNIFYSICFYCAVHHNCVEFIYPSNHIFLDKLIICSNIVSKFMMNPNSTPKLCVDLLLKTISVKPQIFFYTRRWCIINVLRTSVRILSDSAYRKHYYLRHKYLLFQILFQVFHGAILRNIASFKKEKVIYTEKNPQPKYYNMLIDMFLVFSGETRLEPHPKYICKVQSLLQTTPLCSMLTTYISPVW